MPTHQLHELHVQPCRATATAPVFTFWAAAKASRNSRCVASTCARAVDDDRAADTSASLASCIALDGGGIAELLVSLDQGLSDRTDLFRTMRDNPGIRPRNDELPSSTTSVSGIAAIFGEAAFLGETRKR